MQPMLAITARQEGLLYLNGSFCGELGPERTLFRPVNPFGALYLDYHPLTDAHRPMTRRLVLSGGHVLRESAEAAAGISLVLWPGGVVELELEPAPWQQPRQSFSLGGKQFILEGSAEPGLWCEGALLGSLPVGAARPELHSLRETSLLLGSCRDGMYLMMLDREMHAATGFLMARRITLEAGDQALALLEPGDLVGHAVQERWLLSRAGLSLLSSEAAWADGSPRLPRTPEDTAIAAVEASLAGLMDEAESYLTPELVDRRPLDRLADVCDLCVRMKYPAPDGRSCVGLLQLEGGNLAQVRPLYLHAVPSGGPTPYLLDALSLD